MSRASHLVPCFLWVLFFCSPEMPGQALTQPSQAIVLPSMPTTPIEKFVSQTLLPLAERALESSETSDKDLLTLKQQTIDDDAQRKKEQADSARLLKEQSDRADKLQTFSDDLLKQLGIFSGTEDEKHAAATKAIEGIQLRAKALEAENSLLKIGGSILLVGAAVLGGYEGGHALKWW